MDTFYKIIAILSCGGKHILFGDDSISSQLEMKIKTEVKDVISEFDLKKIQTNELYTMEKIASLLQYKEIDLDLIEQFKGTMQIDQFIILYVCLESYNLCKYIAGQEYSDKFNIETDFLEARQYIEESEYDSSL